MNVILWSWDVSYESMIPDRVANTRRLPNDEGGGPRVVVSTAAFHARLLIRLVSHPWRRKHFISIVFHEKRAWRALRVQGVKMT